MDIGKRGIAMKRKTRWRTPVLIALSFSFLVAAALPARADFAAGSKAMQAGDYATALREFQVAAVRGEARAQNDLGVLFERGWGVKQDFAEAANWYRKAADQGDLQA